MNKAIHFWVCVAHHCSKRRSKLNPFSEEAQVLMQLEMDAEIYRRMPLRPFAPYGRITAERINDFIDIFLSTRSQTFDKPKTPRLN